MIETSQSSHGRVQGERKGLSDEIEREMRLIQTSTSSRSVAVIQAEIDVSTQSQECQPKTTKERVCRPSWRVIRYRSGATGRKRVTRCKTVETPVPVADFCRAVAPLRLELAAARSLEDRKAKVQRLRAKLALLDTTVSADPGSQYINRMTGLDPAIVRSLATLVAAIAVEVLCVIAFVLFSTGPAPARLEIKSAVDNTAKAPVKADPTAMNATNLAEYLRFILETRRNVPGAVYDGNSVRMKRADIAAAFDCSVSAVAGALTQLRSTPGLTIQSSNAGMTFTFE